MTEAQNRWYHANKDRLRASLAKRAREYNHSKRGVQTRAIRRARQRAEAEGWPFGITVEDLVWPTHCPVLGIQLTYGLKGGRPRDDSPSLDRIVPSRGYVVGNVAVISWRANRLKNDAAVHEVRAILRYLEERL